MSSAMLIYLQTQSLKKGRGKLHKPRHKESGHDTSDAVLM
jgi:hypothetical protein